MPAPLASVTGYIAGIATHKDLPTLDAYIASEAFLKLLAAVPPKQRPSVFMAYATARTSCLTRMKIAAAGAAKANWKKPGEIDRFKRLWQKHNGDRLLVASEMGITEGAAIKAHSRFIVNGATATYVPVKNGAGRPQERRSASRQHSMAATANTSAAPLPAAA